MLTWRWCTALLIALLAFANSGHASPSEACARALTADPDRGLAERALWMDQKSVLVGLRGHRKGDLNHLPQNNLIFTHADTSDVLLEWIASEWLRPHVSGLQDVHLSFEPIQEGDSLFQVRVTDGKKETLLLIHPEQRKVENLTELAVARGKLLLRQRHAGFRKTQKHLSSNERLRSPWRVISHAVHSVARHSGLVLYSITLSDGAIPETYFFVEPAFSNDSLESRSKKLPSVHWLQAEWDAYGPRPGFAFEDQVIYFVYRDGRVEFRNSSDGRISQELPPIPAPSPIPSNSREEHHQRPTLNTNILTINDDFSAPTLILGVQTRGRLSRLIGYRLVSGHGWRFFEVPGAHEPQSSLSSEYIKGVAFDSTGRFLLIDRFRQSSNGIFVVDLRPLAELGDGTNAVTPPKQVWGYKLIRFSSRAAQTRDGEVLVEADMEGQEQMRNSAVAWDRRRVIANPGYAQRLRRLDLSSATVTAERIPSPLAQDGADPIKIVGGSRLYENYLVERGRFVRIP